MVKRAEDAFADLTDSQFALGFVNGTATLHTALECLFLEPGDEVIVPPLTMSATAFAVLQSNAIPIFADVKRDTFQIDPESVAAKITRKTKAVITVALYGTCPDYYELKKVLNGIPIIEDNAEAIGATYDQTPIGGFGIFGSYSFQSSKHLSAGEGGMLTCESEELATLARKIQSLGYTAVGASKSKISKMEIQDPNYFRHEILGWNYRMSDLTAAVVLGQIENSRKLIQTRMLTAEKLKNVIQGCDWLSIQGTEKLANHSYWAFPALLTRDDITWHEFRDKFVENGGKGIYAAWQLSYFEPLFQNRNLLGRQKWIAESYFKSLKTGLCYKCQTPLSTPISSCFVDCNSCSRTNLFLCHIIPK
jgi:perosamine synthetase